MSTHDRCGFAFKRTSDGASQTCDIYRYLHGAGGWNHDFVNPVGVERVVIGPVEPLSSPATFRAELEMLINRCSMENGSNTPDFILAKFMSNCLAAFDAAVYERETWFGRTR